jgi:hypothetical protein
MQNLLLRTTLFVPKKIIAEHDVKVSGGLSVSGLATFAGPVTLGQGLRFANNNAFNYSSSSFGDVFTLGKGNGTPIQLPACAMFNPGQNNGGIIMDVTGVFVARDANNVSPTILGFDGANHILEAGHTGAINPTNGLLINYYCGKPTYINTGSNGGKVFIGEFFNAAKHVEIGHPTVPIWDGNNVALDINANAGKGIKFNTTNNGLPLISIANPNFNNYSPFTLFGEGNIEMNSTNAGKKMIVIKDPNAVTPNKERFTVYANGATFIGVKKPIASSVHGNALLAVDGKVLAKEVYVNIHNSIWADYVFDKNYKLMPLKEVEKYIAANKHLPNVPSEKDLTDTDDYNLSLSDMQRLQMEKIEELYLHVIQQQKDIEALKLENEKLKILVQKK